jgi:hypothetical protein
MPYFLTTFLCLSMLTLSSAKADYALGCDDPEYRQYMQLRLAHYDAKNRRLYHESLLDYERSVSASNNPYQVIGDLSRHLKYSAQFDDIDVAKAKIDRVFEHTNELSSEEHIAGLVFDNFSSETHFVGIARAWIAYRQGNKERAFEELLNSITVNDSAVLSSFGPDFELVRQLYQDGHVEPVLSYIDKSEQFWKGRRPDGMRYVWREMIKAECQVQFDSVDTIKALELGLSVIDVNKDYGLSR